MVRSFVGPSVSVVIPTFNRSELLGRTLTTLTEQHGTEPGDFQVVVADDGSTDDTAATARSFESDLELVYVRQPRAGFRAAAARNLGAQAAEGDVLVFLDTGTLAGPTFVAGHRAVHGELSIEDPRTWRAVFAPTFGYDVGPESATAVRHRFMDAARPLTPTDFPAVDGMSDYRDGKLAEIDFEVDRLAVPWRFFWSRNVSVPRRAYDDVGGFDESFREYGVEDIELGYRLHRKGVPFAWAPEAWAAEVPTFTEDVAGRATSNRRNLLRMLSMYADVEVEFYVTNRPLPRDEQQEFEALTAWMSTLGPERSEDLVDEFALPATGSVLVVGAGSGFAQPRPRTTCLDPTAPPCPDAWARARQAPSSVVVPVVGLRTAFDDEEFDLVVVTRRMAGRWARWGSYILAECSRIGGTVVTSASLPAPDEL